MALPLPVTTEVLEPQVVPHLVMVLMGYLAYLLGVVAGVGGVGKVGYLVAGAVLEPHLLLTQEQVGVYRQITPLVAGITLLQTRFYVYATTHSLQHQIQISHSPPLMECRDVVAHAPAPRQFPQVMVVLVGVEQLVGRQQLIQQGMVDLVVVVQQ